MKIKKDRRSTPRKIKKCLIKEKPKWAKKLSFKIFENKKPKQKISFSKVISIKNTLKKKNKLKDQFIKQFFLENNTPQVKEVIYDLNVLQNFDVPFFEEFPEKKRRSESSKNKSLNVRRKVTQSLKIKDKKKKISFRKKNIKSKIIFIYKKMMRKLQKNPLSLEKIKRKKRKQENKVKICLNQIKSTNIIIQKKFGEIVVSKLT